MVQRKVVASKLGIQVEHVINKSDKLFVTNMKLSSSNQNIDEKNRVSDMKKKKIKKMKSIKLSDLEETLQTSSPSSSSTSSPSSSSKKQHPNYMKPTSSSHAKKELFAVSDYKNSPRKFSSGSSKATTSVSSSSNKKSTKTLTRSSSLSLVRTLTKRTSFKACRKSPRASICGDMKEKSHRATCSSTLKESKFPEYLMLSSGGTELEGSSIVKVCPYTYCSLNGHHHAADFPPLKSFISSRRRHLKRAKVEAISPQRLKVLPSNETEKKDFDVEKNEFDAKLAYDEIGMGDIFIDIYANEKDVESIGSEEMGKTDFVKEVEDQEVESTIEDDCIEASEEGVNVIHAIPSVTDEDHQTNCSNDHEEMSMGSYCSDEEQIEDVDNYMQLDDSDSDFDSDSKSNGMNWEEEEQFYEFDHEKDADNSSDNDSKVESLSESSHDMSITWLDDILNSYYEDILVDQTLKESKLEENENQVDDVANCSMKKELDGDTNDNIQCQNMSETCKVDETIEENKDIDNINSNENQIELLDETKESIKDVKDILEVEKKDEAKDNKLKSKSCKYEEEETSENWKGLIRGKRGIEDEDDDEMKSFNPREPNFLPLVAEEEGEKVDLKHQMMDERKNADEWMIDCALRQVVTKLAPARKKKVALLVEAFESVMPIQKFGSHLRNHSGFAHSRHIQACS